LGPLSSDAQILQGIRGICESLPDCEEKVSFGHPAFAVSGRIFAVLEEYKGDLSLCILENCPMQDDHETNMDSNAG
jgi:hypothetical protein